MPTRTVFDRVAFTPKEFAAMFGKSQTWGYRQIYAGKVKTITHHGHILIPAAEVERILAEAGTYNGEKKRVAKTVSKAELWDRVVASLRMAKAGGGKAKRSTALARLRPTKSKGNGATPARSKRR
jgi:hypothetical protein